MNKILECKNLYKKLGKKQILKDVSFDIYEGDIMAFIGPNGAGKTTTIKLILGLQSIDKGSVIINGYNVKTDFVKAIERVGCIVENPDVYMYLSGYDNLKLIANTYKNISKEKIDELVDLVGLERRIKDKVSKYSLGMRQRLGIAIDLINDPNILILDEPTNGLDPEGIKDLRNLLKKLAKEKNMGILISSHNLAELESFCSKVCVISDGEIIDYNDIKKFKHVDNVYRIIVDDTSKIKLKDMKNVKKTSFEINASKEQISKIIKELVKQDIDIYEVVELELSLEEAFLQKAGGNKID